MPIDPTAVMWSASADERADRPLIVLLHGLSSHEGDLFGLAPYLPLDAVVASVRAPLVAPPGYAWFPRDPERPGNPLAAAVDPGVDALADWLRGLPPHPSVGLFGFSQGGAVAVHALRRHPGIADYAVNLAGFVVDGDQPGDARLAATRPPVFWGRGAVDPVIPAAAIARTEAWLPGHSTLETGVYEGLGHAISEAELGDVTAFLRARLA